MGTLLGLEARHLWFPPDGSGVTRTNLIENPIAGGGSAAKWASVSLESGPTAVTLGAGEAPAATTLGLSGVTTGFQAKGNAAEDRAVHTIAVTTGRTYRFSVYVWVKEASTSSVRLVARNAGGTVKATSAVNAKEEAWLRLNVSVTADSTGNWTFGIEQTAAGATNFIYTGALVEEATVLNNFYPTPTQITQGRAKYTGTANESKSTYEAPAITFGLLTDDAGTKLWPNLKLKTIGGLLSLGESEDNRDKRLGDVGEITRLSSRRGKSITYEGWIRARTDKSMREQSDLLREAFAEQSTEGVMEVQPHPLHPELSLVPQVFYGARALGVEIVDVQESKFWTRRFVAALRTSDPRYFEPSTQIAKATVANTNTSVDFE